ncbi:50S ribosomal protein L16 [Roseobacter sp. SK209-2-6]|nr:50S ribosomal protein L16 [Roseobacter sp. SK209-2-6]
MDDKSPRPISTPPQAVNKVRTDIGSSPLITIYSASKQTLDPYRKQSVEIR